MPTQLAPTSGTMGYGLPAAVAAALRFKDRPVVCVAGDGDFLMNGQELATAAQYGADLLVILVDNGSYGTIRMHQEREYPERISATELRNPDFAALARAYGGWAETVEATEDFAPALDEALKRKGIRLIHCKTDVEQISNATTITQAARKGEALAFALDLPRLREQQGVDVDLLLELRIALAGLVDRIGPRLRRPGTGRPAHRNGCRSCPFEVAAGAAFRLLRMRKRTELGDKIRCQPGIGSGQVVSDLAGVPMCYSPKG